MGRFAEGKKPLSEAVARARDDLDRAPTIRTGLHINLKNPLEAQRSGSRQGRFAFCARSPWLKPRPRVPIASPSVAQPVCGLRFGLTLWAWRPGPGGPA